MKLLGMQLYPKGKSDEEYVESVRRLVARSRWFGLFHAFACIFFLAMFWWTWRMALSIDSMIADLPVSVERGAFLGVMMGAFAGFALLLAAQNAIWAGQYLRGMRTEKLMLKFHDEWKRADPTASSSNQSAGDRPGFPDR